MTTAAAGGRDASDFDPRSERNLATLLPAAEAQARLFLRRVLDAGIGARIIGGTRTFAEQDALFAQGRTRPGPIVTNARGGFSNHNFGVAWDIGVFRGSEYLPESPDYARAGRIGRGLWLEWGGDWRRFPDRPHFQCRTDLTLRQMRRLVLAGRGDEIPVLPLRGDDASQEAAPVPPEPMPEPVAVFLGGEELAGVPALLIDSRVWVAVRPFADALGGGIVRAGGEPFRATVALNSRQASLNGRDIGGVGYVRFADLNTLLDYGFVFDSLENRLTLSLR